MFRPSVRPITLIYLIVLLILPACGALAAPAAPDAPNAGLLLTWNTFLRDSESTVPVELPSMKAATSTQ